MATEFRLKYAIGKTIYAVMVRASDGLVWNGSSWEALLTANWAKYAIALTQQSTTGFYYGSMPSGVATGLYDINYFSQAGGAPAVAVDSLAGQQALDWTGVVDIGVNDVYERLGQPVNSSLAVDVASVAALATLAFGLIQAPSSTIQTIAPRQPTRPAKWAANNLEQFRD